MPSRQEVTGDTEPEFGGRTSRSQDRRAQPRAARCRAFKHHTLIFSSFFLACQIELSCFSRGDVYAPTGLTYDDVIQTSAGNTLMPGPGGRRLSRQDSR